MVPGRVAPRSAAGLTFLVPDIQNLKRFAIWEHFSNNFLGAACLQNETAPEKLLNRYEKRFEKREKRSEKRSETCLKIVLPLSGRLKIFHQHFSTNLKSFSPPKICTKKRSFFFSQRGSAGVATLKFSCHLLFPESSSGTPADPRNSDSLLEFSEYSQQCAY